MFNFKKENIGEKLILKIDGMHCASCCLNIDMALEELDGVKSANTNYVKSETEVIIDASKVKFEDLKKAVSSLGYKILTPGKLV